MIFTGVWRVLPGAAWVRVLQMLVLLGSVVVVLFTWVFPWIAADLLPQPEATLQR